MGSQFSPPSLPEKKATGLEGQVGKLLSTVGERGWEWTNELYPILHQSVIDVACPLTTHYMRQGNYYAELEYPHCNHDHIRVTLDIAFYNSIRNACIHVCHICDRCKLFKLWPISLIGFLTPVLPIWSNTFDSRLNSSTSFFFNFSLRRPSSARLSFPYRQWWSFR